LDESSIVFESYNLDNSMVLFHDVPKSTHRTRMIIKDIEGCVLQITLEELSKENGWSSNHN